MANRDIFLLTGGSGTGKTTLGNHLKEMGIPEIISHTTREKRVGEVEGETYYFITKEEFDALEKVEWTEYPKNSGNFYCLSKEEVERKLSENGKVFAITDINGLKQLKEQYPEDVKVIYITTTLYQMEKRMRARGDSEDKIQGRLIQAIETNELNNHAFSDFNIENSNLEESKAQVAKIVSL